MQDVNLSAETQMPQAPEMQPAEEASQETAPEGESV